MKIYLVIFITSLKFITFKKNSYNKSVDRDLLFVKDEKTNTKFDNKASSHALERLLNKKISKINYNISLNKKITTINITFDILLIICKTF